jgi:hypothetical protein
MSQNCFQLYENNFKTVQKIGSFKIKTLRITDVSSGFLLFIIEDWNYVKQICLIFLQWQVPKGQVIEVLRSQVLKFSWASGLLKLD